MKRSGIFLVGFVFFLAFFSSIVSAADYSCPLEQQIFRISAQTNAHAEGFNGAGNYPVHICYDDYFGTYTGQREFACTPAFGNNPAILRISGFTDAHAEDPALLNPAYNYDICFNRTLKCVYQEAISACSSDKQEIASFSGRTNAHVGIPGSYTGLGKYRLCCNVTIPIVCGNGVCEGSETPTTCPADCQVGVCGNHVREAPEQCDSPDLNGQTCASLGWDGGTLGCIPQGLPGACQFNTSSCTGANPRLRYAEWQDAQGNVIGSGAGISSYVNRTVQMVEHTNLPEGTQINFALWEDDPIGDDAIAVYTPQVDSTGIARVSIVLSDAIIDSGDPFPEIEGDFEEFYFVVTNGAAQTNTSDVLNVNLTVGPNTPPVANITAPVHRGVYFNGTSVEFRQDSFDLEGGSINSRWTIAEDNYTSNLVSFNYTFQTPGLKTVTLRATDVQGAASEDQVAILVVASPGILGFINNPEHRQPVINNNRIVALNSNESYAINSQGSCPSITVTCLAGVCPTQTQNSPCGGGSLPITGSPQGWNKVYFDWAFSDGDSGTGFADGFGNFQITKEFAQASSSATDYKSASLRLNYTDSALGIYSLLANTNREFSIQTQCISGGERWVEQYDLRTGSILRSYSTRSTDYCKGSDGQYNTLDDCCPLDATNCTVGGCRNQTATICADVKSRNSCVNSTLWRNPNNPGYSDPPACGSTVNGSVVRCSCAWYNSSISTGDYCALNKSASAGSWNGTTSEPPCTPAVCNYLPVTPPSECVNGYAEVTVQANYTAGTCGGGDITEAQCLAGTGPRTILCGRPSIALGFFGSWQFISALAIILAIYYLMGFKKRK